MRAVRYASIFCQLMRVELLIFKETFFDKITNALVWAATTIPITAYILPFFGLSQEYGAFFAAGFGISCGWFEIYPQVTNLIADLEGERHIDYQLSLPLPNWLLFAKMALVTSLNALFMNLICSVAAKIMLANRFPLENFSFVKFICMLVVTSLFFGSFTLLMAGLVKNMQVIGNTFIRTLHPMLFFGGFQFSWHAVSSLVPWLGYVILINPYIYATEGMRAAILGQAGYLPFWSCVCMLLLFSFLFAYLGMRRLKRRLDFV